MKKSLALAAVLTAALTVIMFAAVGCATPTTTTPGTPAVTNYVYSIQPPVPAAPAVTNYAVSYIPATLTAPAITNVVVVMLPATPAQPAVTNLIQQITPAVPGLTTYVPNATVTQLQGYAQQAAPLVPAPWGTVLTGILALTTAITGYIAKKANDNATAAHATASTLAAAIVTNPMTTAQAMNIAANNGTTAGVATKLAAANSPT